MTAKCMKGSSGQIIAIELERCIADGNLKCVLCLSDGVLTPEQKIDLVDAMIAKSSISPETQTWIDNHVSSECYSQKINRADKCPLIFLPVCHRSIYLISC